MKSIKKIVIAVSLIMILTVAFFAKDIKNTYLLYNYSKIFEPETMAENFRNLHTKYPSIKIPAVENAYKIPVTLQKNVLPKEFEFEGKIYNVNDEIAKRKLTSLLIVKDGNIIFEKYYQNNTQQTPAILFSCTKSLMGLLTGIAYEKGFINNLSDPVEKYVPELKNTAYQGVSIQNLLNMSSGVQWIEDYDDVDADVIQSLLASLNGSLNDYTKKMKRIRKQGVFNQYTSMDTQVLAMVIQKATKQPLNDFFVQNLWSKISPENTAYFITDKTGFPLAYGGLMATPRDLAKIGLLMLNKGKNDKGEQVFSEKWIESSITPTEPHLMSGKIKSSDTEEGYKNQWWFPRERYGNDFSALGIYGQTLYINPQDNLIIASNSAYPNYTNDKIGDTRRLKMFQTISKHIANTSDIVSK